MRSPSLTKEMTPLQFARARLMLVLNLILLYTPVMIIMSHIRLNKITPMWALLIKNRLREGVNKKNKKVVIFLLGGSPPHVYMSLT